MSDLSEFIDAYAVLLDAYKNERAYLYESCRARGYAMSEAEVLELSCMDRLIKRSAESLNRLRAHDVSHWCRK